MDDSQGGAVEKETSESTPSLSTMASRVSSLSGNDSPSMAETESIPSTGTPVDEVVEPQALVQRVRSLSEDVTHVAPSQSTPMQRVRSLSEHCTSAKSAEPFVSVSPPQISPWHKVIPPRQGVMSLPEDCTGAKTLEPLVSAASSQISTPIQAASVGRGGSVTMPCPPPTRHFACSAAGVLHDRQQTMSPRGVTRQLSPRYASPHALQMACLPAHSTLVSPRVSQTFTVSVSVQSSQSNVSMTTKIHIGGN